MALTSTIYNFDVDLADADRGCYETFSVRVARHPSESEEYLVARLLAYCLEYTEGIGFSSGLSDPDAPPLSVRDLTGAIHTWIEVGAPDAARLHKASKVAERVAVYLHRDPTQILRQWAATRIHRAERIDVFVFDRPMIAALAARLERRMGLTVTVADRHLFLSLTDATIEGAVTRRHIDGSGT